MIILQQLDKQTKVNLGGLFINPELISEMIPFSYINDKEKLFGTQVVMNNGNFYNTPFVAQKILDMIADYNRLIGKFPKPKLIDLL